MRVGAWSYLTAVDRFLGQCRRDVQLVHDGSGDQEIVRALDGADDKFAALIDQVRLAKMHAQESLHKPVGAQT